MFDKSLLENQTIIVTGGGSGLGYSMAEKLSELSANVVIASRNLERLEDAASKIRAKTKGTVLPIALDVRDHEACVRMVETVESKLGSITGLINNAAGNFLCAAEDLSEKGFDAVVGIVMKGSFNTTQAVGRHMIKEGRGGSVLSILTPYAYTGSAFVLPSAMAKAGVLAMTRSLAVEWGSAYGIRCNAIAPGPFPTKGAWAALLPVPTLEEQAKKRIPLQRFGEHHELANLTAYLMSPSAAYINGDCITIDGGGWLKGAGDFNSFVDLDRDNFKQMLAAMRGTK